ncbi:peptide chain release factor N(5)-glutamine methyltransferase [Candidatus Daviesbacteria bacterium]|nr:peptide chain release factor N(5)-glutamine methyltransferase [Candidatus Daviesbacteria bacterium]
MRLPRRFAPRNDSNQPKQYIKGYVEFYKLRFKVTPDTLIPRPETELLVDEVLNSIKSINKKDILVVDVGTGAGNIAISIAKNTSQVKIIAVDISEKALKVAKQNAKLHSVENRIKFIQSDLLSAVDCNLKPVTCNLIVVTNLPYIPSARIPYLDSSVKDFEPHIALDGGEDGFKLYRKLFQQIKQLSTPGVDSKLHTGCGDSKLKLIVCEIDYTHGELAAIEALKYFPDARIKVNKDLAHLQRILLIFCSH